MEEEYRSYKITINVDEHVDDENDNPRNHDGNITTMFCWHDNLLLGDHKLNPYSNEDVKGMGDSIVDRIKGDYDCIIDPVLIKMYDHSGIGLAMDKTVEVHSYPFNCKMDSMWVGVIFVEKDKMLKSMGWGSIDFNANYDDRLPRVKKNMLAEFKAYDDYVRGNIWMYEIIDPAGDHVDSCGGWIGDSDECLKEAKAVVDNTIATHTPLTGPVIQTIMVNVMQGVGSRGDFLKSLATTWIRADGENQDLLENVMKELINKYNLKTPLYLGEGINAKQK